MKYFRAAFIQFAVSDPTTKWQALKVDIIMGCMISSLLFIVSMELVLRCAVDTAKGVTT